LKLMPTPSLIKQQIDRLTIDLVKISLAHDQQFCFQKSIFENKIEISFPGASHVSIAMKDRFYSDIYDHLAKERAYNVKMLDGAIIQMMYVFDNNGLEQHRLAFFPSPHLDKFQNYPDIYLEDEIYSDIISKNIVPFPIRFDYDAREGCYREIEHPKSHLSLGQYENCRIPVSSPLTPSHFLRFILRNFYHTAHQKYAEELPSFTKAFPESILPIEKDLIYLHVPQSR